MLRGDSRGYVFEHVTTLTEDPYINTAVTPSSWGTKTIKYDYKSCAIDFGNSAIRKFVPWINVNLHNNSSQQSVGLNSYNDNRSNVSASNTNLVYAELIPYKWRGNCLWGDPTIVWGTPSIWWNYRGLLSFKRRFPAKTLRLMTKQIELTNALLKLKDSTYAGTATLNVGALTFTLDDTAKSWLTACEGHYIKFSYDGYVEKFEISRRNSATVLTVLDPLGKIPTSASYSWELWGYPKSEVLKIVSYDFHAIPLSKTMVAERTDSSSGPP